MNAQRLNITIISSFLFLFSIILIGCEDKQPVASQSTTTPKVLPEKGQPVEPASEKINHRPRVTSIDVTPEIPKIGDIIIPQLTAEDQDGDEITYYYKWFKNNELISEDERLELKPEIFKRGDEIKLIVIPFDGHIEGDQGIASLLISNVPPEILSPPKEGKVQNRVFTYQIKAFDPDGDTLTYSLQSAPQGMTIDENGLIKWNIPPNFKGKASVTILVTDAHGGEAFYNFELIF